ncbi:ATP-dependent RNA helicase dbp10 [Friedmanniomyces endolithicus]|uniref:RNA helicase n=1 Tax=Rachicladosporium monterosium TaxID=1507873 RepID=A0ABR0L6E8_9PEZI|nr:ATP-dependent RNA helicase dbp10 [Friedmanniomyces endolithicus]KAK5144214.1 ATP-dependent RNA helicase dbp10 [Rachicladosporium monterosium]
MVRAASPTVSETEFDISKSLFQDGSFGSDADSAAEETTGQPKKQTAIEAESEEDEAFIAATQAAANRKNDPKTGKKTGAFQSMGLNTHLLKAIARKGFTVPTPIQRKTIPLIMDRQDVVGMARTGSGKTAAFVIPMIERLKSHSAKVGARAVVLSPSRELALQTLKVIKELGKGTDLRTTLLVGGDSLEEQFGSMASNPDIIIATPGRFEHLKVEMGLELSSVRYVVFDEADRLFEMGFAAQLTEIVHSLPASRQTLLFSATLPKSLVEFARAGLQDPKLVRLDAESKISPGLESVFLTVKRAEKEGALLHILQDIIQMPTGATEAVIKAREREANPGKKLENEIDLFKNAVVVGSPVRDRLERCCEEAGKLLDEDGDLAAMRDVSVKGEKQYLRTRNAASSESVKRAKQIVGQGAMGTNMLFQDGENRGMEQQRLDMLAKVSGFRPQETVFEIGRRGGTNTETADLIRRQRERIENRERKNAARRAAGGQQMTDAPQSSAASFQAAPEDQASAESEDELQLTQPAGANMDEASDSELELTFSAPTESASKGRKKTSGDSWQDSEHFMSYTPTGFNAAEDRGYGVHSGGTSSHFVNVAKDATMDLAQDESSAFKEASKPGMRWDKKKKDYVRRENDEDGSKGQKFIRGESGQKIPASFRSGRFDAWRKANKVERMPRVGELERSGAHYAGGGAAAAAGGKRFKHKQERAPKEADKYRDDYQERKAKVAAAKEKRVGRFADGKGKSELRGVDDVRKVRKMQEKRRDKNARPSRKRT